MATNTGDLDCEVSVSEARLSLWPELFWGLEWLQLVRSPLYRGVGVARGRGQPVVLVPGFLASDASLRELRSWLGRIGYRPFPSGIGRNSDCPDVLLDDILRTVRTVSGETGRPVRLIGHSFGGMLARAAAARRPDLVAQVITLGTPIRGVSAHPLVLAIARFMGRVTPSPSQRPRQHGDHVHATTCACRLTLALARPFPAGVSRTSLFSRRDGVVDWRSSLDTTGGVNKEVRASHLGLPVNVEVYENIAWLLASLESEPLAARDDLSAQGGELPDQNRMRAA